VLPRLRGSKLSTASSITTTRVTRSPPATDSNASSGFPRCRRRDNVTSFTERNLHNSRLEFFAISIKFPSGIRSISDEGWDIPLFFRACGVQSAAGGWCIMATGQLEKFNCDGCGKSYRWKAELAGKRVKCKCGH